MHNSETARQISADAEIGLALVLDLIVRGGGRNSSFRGWALIATMRGFAGSSFTGR